MNITKNNKINTSQISEELFNIVKLIFRDNMDLDCPVDVWRMWIKKETKSWDNFVLWFLDFNKKIDVKLQEFLYLHNGNFETFVENWVDDDEQMSFYEFYAEKKWEDVLSNIQRTFMNTSKTSTKNHLCID